MVPRTIWYVQGNRVCNKCVELTWDLGWSREAKTEYVKRLHATVRSYFPNKVIAEVTTAGPKWSRVLSPEIMMFDGGKTFEDVIRELNHAHKDLYVYDGFVWRKPITKLTLIHFYCYYGDYMLDLVRRIDVFTDVFFNPVTLKSSSQAEAAAVMKLLDMQNNMGILKRPQEFFGVV